MTIYLATGTILLSVEVDDSSYRYREIMGDHNLTLYFSLAEHVEIPLGAYTTYQGETYTLLRPEALKMQHTRLFDYTVTMESAQYYTKLWKFRNTVDGRLAFSLTAKPHEHLEMLVENMNRWGSGWEVGEYIDDVEHCVTYDHNSCWEALSMMADEFETEFEIVGKVVSLRKVEYNKNNPLPLSYGKGNGFTSGVGRSNYSDTPPVEVLFTQGGTDNIDASEYGSSELHLPKGGTLKYDGTYFEDEDGFDEDSAREYEADEDGYSISRVNGTVRCHAEESLDCSDYYPKRVGEVTEVIVDDADNNFYDIVDDTIPSSLDFEDCLIDGETMTIIFQSGMLAGKEFDVSYVHDDRRFEIVPQEIDGETMPNETYIPVVGDTYAVFHCMLPQAYINAYEEDGETKEGAEWDMMRAAVRYMYDNEEEQFEFSGTLDGIYARKNWENIGGRILLGGYVLFSDDRFQADGVAVRITSIKDKINTPYAPEITLSNNTITGSFATTLAELEASEVLHEETTRDTIQYTKRTFRSAQETLTLLQELTEALQTQFTSAISPITVQTMALLVGDESLQFRYVDSKTDPSVVEYGITYDQEAKQLYCPAGILQHMTLGITSVSSSHDASEYSYWDMAEYTSAYLEDGDASYYLYAVCNKTTYTGTYMLSETALDMDGDTDYYFLVGILNAEYDGERDFVTLYGYTEILPGRITTDKIVSGDGESYFDMANDAMKLGDVLAFNVEGGGELVLNNGTFQLEADGSIHAGDDDSYMEYDAGDSTLSITGALNAAGGTIGSFTVSSSGWLSADNNNDEGGTYGMDISAAVLQVSSTDMAVGSTTFNVTARLQAYASATISTHAAASLISAVDGEYTNHAVYVSASGDNKANYGLYVAAGLTKLRGVENNVLVISSTTTVYLDDEGSDSINTILFSATGSTTVYLPASPNSGRTILVINRSGYSLVLNSNGKYLYNLKGSSSGSTYTSSNQEMTWLVYYSSYWYVAHSEN